jgi:hypothetical protein
MKRAYTSEPRRFRPEALAKIAQANDIIAEYRRQGFSLTLRQLYYQFVARGLVPNRDREYKNLGELVNDGRMAGLIDWSAIEDRTRYARTVSFFDSAEQIMNAAAEGLTFDRWEGQAEYVEVWIEKDALVGVIQRPCNRLDVPYFSCRGYVSASAMHDAGTRIVRKLVEGREVTILHLGDHDPSGLDMTRDITDRLTTFAGWDLAYDHGLRGPDLTEALGRFHVKRIALTMEQVEEWNPPPNPAKITDSRAMAYIEEWGDESWELDALDPTTLSELITAEVEERYDLDLRQAVLDKEEEEKRVLRAARDRWEDLPELLGLES